MRIQDGLDDQTVELSARIKLVNDLTILVRGPTSDDATSKALRAEAIKALKIAKQEALRVAKAYVKVAADVGRSAA